MVNGSPEEKLKLLQGECERLRTENTHLRSLIESDSQATIQIEEPNRKPQVSEVPVPDNRSVEEKVSLFRALFRGREDIYALRWERLGGRLF